MHGDGDYNCPQSCDFKGMILLKQINIGVVFGKDIIQSLRLRCIEEPSKELVTEWTKNEHLFEQIEYYSAFMTFVKESDPARVKIKLQKSKVQGV